MLMYDPSSTLMQTPLFFAIFIICWVGASSLAWLSFSFLIINICGRVIQLQPGEAAERNDFSASRLFFWLQTTAVPYYSILMPPVRDSNSKHDAMLSMGTAGHVIVAVSLFIGASSPLR